MDFYSVATASPQLSGVKALAALFATMDPKKTYVADSGRWAEALLGLRDKFGDEFSTFFESIGFVQRSGSRPYSREVSQFLTYMQLGGMVEVPNSTYAVLRIKPEAQAQMLELYMKDPAVASVMGAVRALTGPLTSALEVDPQPEL